MVKIHSRVKRRLQRGIGTNLKHKFLLKGIRRKHRPKSFSTESGANKYAAEKGIKNFTLKVVKKGKRFQVVPKN